MNDVSWTAGPRFAPYANGRYALAMGMVGLDLKDWFLVCERRAAELGEKERLLAFDREAVFGALPGSEEVQREVLMLALDNLERHHQGLVAFEAGEIRIAETGTLYRMEDFADRALDLAARLVQEDLCIMSPGPEGYVLRAGSVCFPARWRLADKLGRPMMKIHEPVAGYAEKLGKPVDRFFEHLKEDKPIYRLNWSIMDDPALFQSSGHSSHAARPEITAANAGEKLWIRVERQTLRRLPRSGDILFTIRTFVDPLKSLEARPELAAGLKSSLAEMPEEMQIYKSVLPIRAALDGYLERISAGAV